MNHTQRIVTQTDLKDAIRRLEEKHMADGKELKEQFEMAYESLKPINLIKSTFSGIGSSKEIKGSLINTSIGLAAGVLSKVLFVGFSGNPLRRLAGTMLMFGVTKLVSKNPTPLKTLGSKLLNMVIRKRHQRENQQLLH